MSVTATDDAKHMFFTRLADRGFERATFSDGQARTYPLDRLIFSTKKNSVGQEFDKVPMSLRGRLLLIFEEVPVDRLIVFGRRCFPEPERAREGGTRRHAVGGGVC